MLLLSLPAACNKLRFLKDEKDSVNLQPSQLLPVYCNKVSVFFPSTSTSLPL